MIPAERLVIVRDEVVPTRAQVAERIAAGLATQQIAEDLMVSPTPSLHNGLSPFLTKHVAGQRVDSRPELYVK